MPIYNLDATVTYQPQIAIIKLEGEINNLAEQVLDRSFSEAESSHSSYILLNFTGVRYMNSSGIALIVGLIGRARRVNKHLLACGLSQHFVEIFQVTRLSDFIKIYPDEISIYTDPALNVRV